VEKSFSFTVALREISTIGFSYRNFHALFEPFLAQKAHENYHKKGSFLITLFEIKLL
jgi:hypothetical protein